MPSLFLEHPGVISRLFLMSEQSGGDGSRFGRTVSPVCVYVGARRAVPAFQFTKPTHARHARVKDTVYYQAIRPGPAGFQSAPARVWFQLSNLAF